MTDKMIRTLPEVVYAAPRLSARTEQLVPASANLWRVHDAAGRVRGHLRMVTDPLGIRYRAERLHLATGAFRLIGEFWRPDDAVAALRHG